MAYMARSAAGPSSRWHAPEHLSQIRIYSRIAWWIDFKLDGLREEMEEIKQAVVDLAHGTILAKRGIKRVL